jgi:hypothetical protein
VDLQKVFLSDDLHDDPAGERSWLDAVLLA